MNQIWRPGIVSLPMLMDNYEEYYRAMAIVEPAIVQPTKRWVARSWGYDFSPVYNLRFRQQRPLPRWPICAGGGYEPVASCTMSFCRLYGAATTLIVTPESSPLPGRYHRRRSNQLWRRRRQSGRVPHQRFSHAYLQRSGYFIANRER